MSVLLNPSFPSALASWREDRARASRQVHSKHRRADRATVAQRLGLQQIGKAVRTSHKQRPTTNSTESAVHALTEDFDPSLPIGPNLRRHGPWRLPTAQNTDDANVFVDIGPVNAHRRQFDPRAPLRRRVRQTRIPQSGARNTRPSLSWTVRLSLSHAAPTGVASSTSICKVVIPSSQKSVSLLTSLPDLPRRIADIGRDRQIAKPTTSSRRS